MNTKEHKPNVLPQRILDWTLATAVGVIGGFTGLASQVRTVFRKKLGNFIGDLDIPTLTAQRDALLKGTPLPDDLFKENTLLAEKFKEFGTDVKVKVIDELIAMKNMHAGRAHKLDENMLTRFLKSFDPAHTKLQDAATDVYLTNAPAIKNEYTRGLNRLANHLGIETEGVAGFVKGTLQRSRYMGRDTKSFLFTNAGITFCAAMAGTLMFAGSFHTRKKLNEIDDHVVDNMRELDARLSAMEREKAGQTR